MKIAIGIFVLIGLALWACAKYSASKETNPDDYASAFVYFASWGAFGIAGILTVIFALFRLFSS